MKEKLDSNLKGVLTSWSKVSDLPHGIRRKGNTVSHQSVLEDGLHSKSYVLTIRKERKKNYFKKWTIGRRIEVLVGNNKLNTFFLNRVVNHLDKENGKKGRRVVLILNY